MLPANRSSSSDFDPRQAPGALLYEASDIPQGMTIAQWRRSRVAAVALSGRRWFVRRRPRSV